MRTLASEIKDAVFERNQKGSFVRLFDITCNDTDILHLTNHPYPITYNETIYSPYPITLSETEESSKPELRTFNVIVANIDQVFVSYLENGGLRGRDIKITLIFIRE